MPGTGGMETLKRLRNSGDQTPVVVVTAHGGIAEAVAAVKLGATDFLPKPVSPTSLREVVASASTSARASAKPSQASAPVQRLPEESRAVAAAPPLRPRRRGTIGGRLFSRKTSSASGVRWTGASSTTPSSSCASPMP